MEVNYNTRLPLNLNVIYTLQDHKMIFMGDLKTVNLEWRFLLMTDNIKWHSFT